MNLTPLTWSGLALLIFGAAFAYDYAIAKYVRATTHSDRKWLKKNTRSRRHTAARWSVVTYLIGLIGLYGVLNVSVTLIPAEALGLYLGTYLGSRSSR
jgi:hypothetical protein